MSGYSSTASRLYETTPRTTSATIIMVAKTGRLIETSERNIGGARLTAGGGCAAGRRRIGADDRDLHAAAQGPDVADDHQVARAQPAGDLRQRAAGVDDADGDRNRLELLVLDAIDERGAARCSA